MCEEWECRGFCEARKTNHFDGFGDTDAGVDGIGL